jgi:type II secretory pathway pseudopilin PulG
MRARLQDESGFSIVELVVAVMVITVALLAIAAGFETAAVSVHAAAKKTVAAKLANAQIERYAALAFTSIGLDATTLTNTKTSGNPSYSSTYVSDETALNAVTGGTDVSISGCGSTAAQCLPVQTVTGTDNKSYKLETFIRDVVSFGTWTERIVTVIVRNPNVSGTPEIFRLTSGFDKGP